MDLNKPEYYINRELSWLDFNKRVFEEAQDKTNPVFERLKFLAITSSNLDEFFMVRVSGLMDLVEADISFKDAAGLTPKEQLSEISKKSHELVAAQYNCLNRSILPILRKEGINFLNFTELNDKQKSYAESYFNDTVYPILTPMAIDQSRPLPLLNNRSLNIIAELKDIKNGNSADLENYFAVVQIPTVIKRIITLPPSCDGKSEFIFLENIVKEHIEKLFTGYELLSCSLFRITRNSDLTISEDESDDLMYEIEKSIKRRKWGDPVRIEIEKNMAASTRSFLEASFELDDEDIYRISGTLDLTVFMGFSQQKGFERLRNENLPAHFPIDFADRDMFEVIREKDVLVFHPYESFNCVVNFVNAAAADPECLAIKQTLYRVSGNSPIVEALMNAAENGKQVTVLVELKARFDEENNIIWARKLEKSGCHVVYGLIGLKTHCKICLIVRREEDGIRRYVHLGTGNYNDSTAKTYTDLGFFTCKESFGRDTSALFNLLTGYSSNTDWNKIAVAPTTLRQMFLRYIAYEEKNAAGGKDALIVAKMNSLVDVEIIQALYRASAAGVKIRLIVRGVCCLRAGVKDISENITVVSIVDRFLEHSRIFYFENAGTPKIFLSSADWMPRNLDRRVEVAFPIEDADLMERLIEILDITLSDNVKLRNMNADGSYEKISRRGKAILQSQLLFHKLYADKVKANRERQVLSFKPV